MRADLHTHSWYSPDGWMSPEHLLRVAKKQRLGAIAVTDHNRLTVVQSDDILVIPGEEIRTTHGELIGLGITEEIPAGLSPEETTDRILEQGGIVVIPHPFDEFRRKSALLLNYDYGPRKRTAVEVLNARYLSWKPYERALAYAIAHNLPTLGSSDAHTPWEIGRAYTFMHYCDDVDCVLGRILKKEVVPKGRLSPPWVHGFSPLGRVAHSLRLMPL
ncbi:MAG: PHP domain-containing protein [Candidatus Diapherotrites archaeon]|nr:PHP domain-containing protein [Candidatus Diapherotrites archaeon]